MAKAQRQQRQVEQESATKQPATEVSESNSDAAGALPSAAPEHSLLSAVPGGEGLHAGGCGCANCLGGVGGVHASFTHVNADGTVTNQVGEQVADDAAHELGTGESPPSFEAPGAGSAEAVSVGRHQGFPAIYGQTYYSEAALPSFPRLSFEFGRTLTLDHTCTSKPTTWGEPSFSAIAIGENMGEGYSVTTSQKDYPSYQHFVLVSGGAATNIAMAEEQHIQDLNEGWNITANQIGDAINAVAAGDAPEGDTMGEAKTACVDAIAGQLGGLGSQVRDKLISGGEIALPGAMNQAFTQSKSQRDGKGTHSFPLELYTAHADTQKVASIVPDKALDQTPSSAIVNHGTIL